MIAKILDAVERNLIPFALCSTFVSFGTMLMGLTLFALTGHCVYDKRFFPTISATELRAPEYYVYVVGFTYSAIALSLSICVVHMRFIAPVLRKKKWALWMNYLSLATGVTAALGFGVQTYWPVKHIVHTLGSGVFFFLGFMYCLLVAIVTRAQECLEQCFQRMWRAKLYMLVAYGIFVCIFGADLLDSYMGGRTFSKIYLDTLPEWGSVYAFVVFFSTFSFDAREYYKKKSSEAVSSQGFVLTEIRDIGDSVPSFSPLPQSYEQNVITHVTSIADANEESLLEVVVNPGASDGNNPMLEVCKESDYLEAEESLMDSITPNAVLVLYLVALLFSIAGFLVLRHAFVRG